MHGPGLAHNVFVLDALSSYSSGLLINKYEIHLGGIAGARNMLNGRNRVCLLMPDLGCATQSHHRTKKT